MSSQTPDLPALYGDRRRWGLLHADALELLRLLPDRSIDAVITDPPYGIGFGGHAWDGGTLAGGSGFERWTTAWAYEVARILRPGGYLAAFGAPRTMHRLVAGVENAGFEIRDQVLWLYSSGMPKTRRYADDLGTALKPAYEPILLARTPLDGTTVASHARWGTGLLDIGATRVRDEVASVADVIGRWPANLGLLHEPACDDRQCHGQCVVRQIDQRAGTDISRFFYAAKAGRSEREAGLEAQPKSTARVGLTPRARARANIHPTVKPLSVMQWLVRLIVPHGGAVLDPFSGSGSTGCAALMENRQFVGIEREAEYVEIARHRLTHWAAQ